MSTFDGASAPQYDELEPSRQEAPSSEGVSPSFEKDPVLVLTGDKAETYCKLLEGLIKGGKANSSFPSGRGLANLAYLLRPSVNRGLTDSVRVNLKNGLPSEPDIGRIIADKDVCKKILASHDVESVQKRTDEASMRLINRIHYYRDVDKREIPDRYSLDLKLRRTNEEAKTADFIALFERYDPGEGVFTRYTISLQHKSERWSKPKVELRGDDLRYTEEFRNVISRYSSDEAEFAFILLSDVPGITVQEIIRCRIGPLWMKGVQGPPQINELLEKYPGNCILNFPQEKVFVPETDDKEDENRDGFARLYRESLPPDHKAIADSRAKRLGYVVQKDRKMVCTKPLLAPLRKLMADLGKPCIIYPSR